jgi:hypothetical protein
MSDTPQTLALLNKIFDRDGVLEEENAPYLWVQLCKRIERQSLAAPELLEALEQTVTSMQDSGYSDKHLIVKAARAAIAKAKGESK